VAPASTASVRSPQSAGRDWLGGCLRDWLRDSVGTAEGQRRDWLRDWLRDSLHEGTPITSRKAARSSLLHGRTVMQQATHTHTHTHRHAIHTRPCTHARPHTCTCTHTHTWKLRAGMKTAAALPDVLACRPASRRCWSLASDAAGSSHTRRTPKHVNAGPSLLVSATFAFPAELVIL